MFRINLKINMRLPCCFILLRLRHGKWSRIHKLWNLSAIVIFLQKSL